MRYIPRTSFARGVLCSAGISLTGLIGCNLQHPQPELPRKLEAEVENYTVSVSHDGYNREMRITAKNEKIVQEPINRISAVIIPSILAFDFGNDGRFDSIVLQGVPKGHDLENYLNFQKLEEMYSKIIEAEKAKIAKEKKTESAEVVFGNSSFDY